ncbi:RPC2 [Acanthosepion pharaonis]|uniref:RPC2 n=1 Tax=Acanthosepion pharaonis TaxID=158019 RepID=A0A812DB02_ACAPH|nr:RPC2 [Sepia pharaonis]
MFNLFFFSLQGVQGVCETNVEETAKRCLSRSMTPTISSGDLLRKDITSLTPGQMKELCQLFRNFEDCIQEELYACIDNKHELKKILESFEHSFNYICHEGFELLMKIKPCTEKPEFKKQMGQCSESAIYRFNETKMRLMTNYMIKEKACR